LLENIEEKSGLRIARNEYTKHSEQDYQDQPDGVLQQQLHDLASLASREIRLKGIYTLLNHAPLRDVFPERQQRSISVIAARIFNSSSLAAGTRGTERAYDYRIAPQEIIERVRRIEEICDRHRVTLPAPQSNLSGAHPAVSTVLLGAERPAEAERNGDCDFS
jgi:aryl-alcohol dehydrogenase-like predicted oxidoreductase